MTEAEWAASEDPRAMLAWLLEGGAEGEYTTPAGHLAFSPRVGRHPAASDRKLRLFACACCRHAWRRLTRPDSRLAVEAAERYADGRLSIAGLAAARWGAIEASPHGLRADSLPVWASVSDEGLAAALGSVVLCPDVEAAGMAALLREIAGDPHRRYAWTKVHECEPSGHEFQLLDERWRTPTVLSLARAAYDERAGRKCEKCGGSGRACAPNPQFTQECSTCRGTGRIDDGTLDPIRLWILADALEEAGCDNEEVLLHLRMRCARPPCGHVRGCWALDLTLGRE